MRKTLDYGVSYNCIISGIVIGGGNEDYETLDAVGDCLEAIEKELLNESKYYRALRLHSLIGQTNDFYGEVVSVIVDELNNIIAVIFELEARSLTFIF